MACLLFSSLPLWAAIDLFLNIPNIPGESQAPGFVNQIELSGFSESIANPVAIIPSGVSNGPAVLGNIVITKNLDATSTPLYLACAQGTMLQNPVVLTVQKAGTTPVVIYTLSLTNVYVKSVASSASGGGSLPAETVTLTCGQIQWSYVPILPNGSAGTPIVHSWNAQNGTGN